MAAFQMLVRALDGRTACFQFSSDTIVGCRLQEFISGQFGIPADFLRIVTGTREVTPQTCLQSDHDGFFPSCNLLLRLRGGKGGFGSLLRGAATKAGQKKTSNFDACRDMSGRRLRHVNAEKKLKEWKAQAKERELEKTANAFLKKQSKRKEEDPASYEEVKKFMEETSRAREEVESAVVTGLAEAERLGKRRKVEAIPTNSERSNFWKAYADFEIGNGIIIDGHETKECNLAIGEGDNGNKGTTKEDNENVVTNKFMNEQLNFDDFHSATDMEVLGLLRLKCELQARGLKCGGSLEERTARLFLLKSTVIEKLDKKHFAKIKGEIHR